MENNDATKAITQSVRTGKTVMVDLLCYELSSLKGRVGLFAAPDDKLDVWGADSSGNQWRVLVRVCDHVGGQVRW